MHDAADGAETLEQRTVTAHRAYLDALIALERIAHAATCPNCAITEFAGLDQMQALAVADEHKEACRVALRNLLDELGYLPLNLTAALPKQRARCIKRETKAGLPEAASNDPLPFTTVRHQVNN